MFVILLPNENWLGSWNAPVMLVFVVWSLEEILEFCKDEDSYLFIDDWGYFFWTYNWSIVKLEPPFYKLLF